MVVVVQLRRELLLSDDTGLPGHLLQAYNPQEDTAAHARQRKRHRTNNQITSGPSNARAGASESSHQAADEGLCSQWVRFATGTLTLTSDFALLLISCAAQALPFPPPHFLIYMSDDPFILQTTGISGFGSSSDGGYSESSNCGPIFPDETPISVLRRERNYHSGCNNQQQGMELQREENCQVS